MTLIVTDLDKVNGGAVNEWCSETDVSVSFAKTKSAFSIATPPMSLPRIHQRTPAFYFFLPLVAARISSIFLSVL